MHSSSLRGDDFEMAVGGRAVRHDEHFRRFTRTRRLGLVAPTRTDGAGAINLVMAYVTAFYDDYRAEGGEFFAYPDFFTFQRQSPPADYGMFDIGPYHKCVAVEPDAAQTLQAITDRGVNVLLVPDGAPVGNSFGDVELASARRNIDRCYVYAFEGRVDDADVTIRCARSPFDQWVGQMFDTVKDDPSLPQRRRAWFDQCSADHLEQSFRRVSMSEALAHL